MKYLIDADKFKAAVAPITPEWLAQKFCGMDSEGQALFFNAIANEVEVWVGSAAWCLQLSYVMQEEHLTDEGRNIMSTIGQYSEKLR